MMHRDDFVVTLRHGDSETTYREYRNSDYADSDAELYRYREVNIPYGSEYRFAFKNMASVRRRIEIHIDGTQIGDWVLGAGSKKVPYESIIERFADSAHKFKVVHPDHPEVADPGSADNGNIVVKVWRETQPHNPLLWMSEKKPQKKPRRNKSLFGRGGRMMGSSVPRGSSGSRRSSSGGNTTKGCSLSSSGSDAHVYSCNVSQDSFLRSADLSADADAGAAATVEGGHSDQTFGKTQWNGDDGAPLVFEFKVKGKGDVEKSYDEEPEVTTTTNVSDENLIRVELVAARDMGKLKKATEIALEQLGFQIHNTKKNGYVLIGYYDGPINVLEQLKGVQDVEELMVS